MNILDQNHLADSGIRLTAAVFTALLLAGCSSFGPSPYDNPPYVLDEYGMVYGAELDSSRREAYLAPRFSAFDPGVSGTFRDPYFGLLSDPYAGFYARQRPYYLRSPFYAGGHRAPILIAPSPGLTPPVAPGPVQPIASPIQSPPELRFRTEPEFTPAGQRRRSISSPETARPRAGNRGQPGARSPSARARRAPSPRVRPAPRPAPSKPRVIDP